MMYQLWAHDTSGEVYAVQIDTTGLIVAATGPLHHSEHAAALAGDFDDDPELREDLIAHNGDYHVRQA